MTPEELEELVDRERTAGDLLQKSNDGHLEAVEDLTLADHLDRDGNRLRKGGPL